jgi:sulfoxide reductase heme-binding subunit YedZ
VAPDLAGLVPVAGLHLTAASSRIGAVVVTPTSPLWYTTRATGLIALVLLTLSVVLGLLTSVRFAAPNWPRFVTVGLHRNLSLIVLVFTGLHIITTVTDSYAHIHLTDAVLPFVSSYRPIWLGLGTAAFDLLVAVAITSLLRVHVGHKVWRLVHWLAYLCWPAAVMHGLGTGTDTPQRWVLAITACCVAAVAAAGSWRLVADWQQRTGVRAAVAATAVVALVAAAVWLVGGPLKPGWARRSGTPASLLARSAAAAGSAGSAGSARAPTGTGPKANAGTGAAASTLPAAPFDASLFGHLSESSAGAGNAVVRITANVTPTGNGARGGDAGRANRAVLGIVISGQSDGNGGIAMSSSRVTFGPAGTPLAYTGKLDGLEGTSMSARVRDRAAHTLRLDISLQPNGNAVTGALRVSLAGSEEGGD